MKKLKSIATDTIGFLFFKSSETAKRPVVAFLIIIVGYFCLVLHEVYQPEFYVTSRASQLTPTAIWIVPPIIFIALVLSVKNFRKQKSEREHERGRT